MFSSLCENIYKLLLFSSLRLFHRRVIELKQSIGILFMYINEISIIYSAASCIIRSILAAQTLNSGIFPIGSSCGLVKIFAEASLKQNGINSIPFGTS